ncbi:helix-turn-helix domain-containing protein [Neisseriaceae bacterium CLB008]
MSTTATLITVLKRELKQAHMTYADLAAALGMAESSVKRMFSLGDMSLSRVDEICQVLDLDFADIAEQVASAQPDVSELTLAQERALIADEKLLLIAICVLSRWSLAQITAQYTFSEAEAIGYFVQLDRIGVIELRPLNRYRLKMGKGMRWQPNGPVMQFFRDHALVDYFSGGFAPADEDLTLTYGSISPKALPAFIKRVQKLASDFADQHQQDSKLSPGKRHGYTMVMAVRRWELALLKTHARR